jgi:hypothetical protein
MSNGIRNNLLRIDGCTRKRIAAALLLLFSAIAAILPVTEAVGANTLTVGAVVLSDNNCTFRSGAATLAFGLIDPGGTTDITRTTTMRFRCGGRDNPATFDFTTDSGRYETGPGAYRMRNTAVTTEYLPYTLSLSPSSGTVPRRVDQTLTITGTVTSPNYRSAYVGNYSDRVIISIDP